MTEIGLEEAVQRTSNNRAARWPSRNATNRLEPECWPEIHPGFKMKRSSPIFTIGSCFARNVEIHLVKLGFNVPAQTLLAENPGLMQYRSELLNKYTPASIYQELLWAKQIRDRDGVVTQDDIEPLILPVENEKFIDSHSQKMVGHGRGLSREELLTHRHWLYRLFAHAFDSDVVIITLGLIECWLDRKTGQFVEFGDYLRKFEADRFIFKRLTFRESYDFMKKSIDLINSSGPRHVLITTSPVTLGRTFTADDVIIANMHSKSVLRAVAGEIAENHPNVDYFPSFESVMLTKQNNVWMNDLRHVEADFVGRIMIRLSETYLEDAERVPDADVESEKLKFVNLATHRQFKAAREVFDRLVMPELSPKTIPYTIAAAEMHSNLGEHDAAQDLARSLRDFALKSRGGYNVLYLQCARLFSAAGNANEAASTRKLAFKDLTDPTAIRNLFRMAMKSGARDDAQRALKHAERRPSQNLQLLKTAVKYYFDMKDFAAAERILRLLIEKSPEYSGALHRLGIALVRQDKTEEALTILEQALVHEPNERQILERLIRTSKTLKRHDKTEHYVRLILSTSPEDSAAHATLANVLGRMGRNDEALTHAVRAAEIDPANEKYRELVKKIVAGERDESDDTDSVNLEAANSGPE